MNRMVFLVFFSKKKIDFVLYKKNMTTVFSKGVMSSKERKNSDEFKSFLSDLSEMKGTLYDYRKEKFGPPTDRDLFTKLIHLPNEEEFVNACQLIVCNVMADFGGKSLWEFGEEIYEKSSYGHGYNKIPSGEIESPDVFFLISQRIEELPNKVFIEGHLY